MDQVGANQVGVASPVFANPHITRTEINNTSGDLEVGQVTTFTVTVDVPDTMNIPVAQWGVDSNPPMAGVMTTASTGAIPQTRPQFDRMKGAKWFQKAQTTEVMILGQGGIGSWLTLLISRLGCTVYTYDMDRYEEHNMTGQLVRNTDIGKLKTTAVAEICREFNEAGWAAIYTNGRFEPSSYLLPVTLCGFDNMDARRLAFSKWRTTIKEHASATAANPSSFFFQDGRLTAEQLMIFNIPGDRPDLMDKYEKEQLFDEKEGYEGDCTFKQTTHAATMIASHMVGFYTNWLTNLITGDKDYAKLPFKYEYVIPFNLTMQDYVNT